MATTTTTTTTVRADVRVEPLFYHYTLSALEDKFLEILSSKNEFEIDKQTGEIHIRWKYIERAERLLYRINIFRPIPEFIISTEDIPLGLLHELHNLGKITMKKTITNAVRRIYESVDPDYFHTNGVYGKVKWRFDSS